MNKNQNKFYKYQYIIILITQDIYFNIHNNIDLSNINKLIKSKKYIYKKQY